MGMIKVQLEPNGPITEMEESLLTKRTGGIDNEVERTTWIEYCLPECNGSAHVTGVSDAEGYFCKKHVHRSVNMYLKRGLLCEGIAASL